ncbi:MAG: hypothetical protein ACE5F1_06835 [Planctomycetota bacterium]
MNPTLAFLAASLLSSPGTGQDSRPGAESFRFNWPVPSEVRVSEKAIKKGRHAEMRYSVRLLRDSDGKHLRVQLRDFEFIKLAGMDVKDPRVRKALVQVMVLAQAIPDVQIDDKGVFVDIIGIDKMVERILEFIEKQTRDSDKGAQKPRTDAIRGILGNPSYRNAMKENVANFWRAWVETWTMQTALPAGQDIAVETSVPFFGGSQIQGALTLRNHGPAPGTPGHVRLTAVGTMQGESMKKALTGLFHKLAAQLPATGAKPFSADMLEVAKATYRYEVVTRPATLQPKRALLEKVITIKMKDQPARQEIERREYRFEWPVAGQSPGK